MLIVVSKIIMGVTFVLDHNSIMHPFVVQYLWATLLGPPAAYYESS